MAGRTSDYQLALTEGIQSVVSKVVGSSIASSTNLTIESSLISAKVTLIDPSVSNTLTPSSNSNTTVTLPPNIVGPGIDIRLVSILYREPIY